MNKIVATLFAVTCTTVQAQQVRVIQPESHPMLPASAIAPGMSRNPADLKPKTIEIPSPIFFEHVAHVAPDGSLSLECRSRRALDLRARVLGQTEDDGP